MGRLGKGNRDCKYRDNKSRRCGKQGKSTHQSYCSEQCREQHEREQLENDESSSSEESSSSNKSLSDNTNKENEDNKKEDNKKEEKKSKKKSEVVGNAQGGGEAAVKVEEKDVKIEATAEQAPRMMITMKLHLIWATSVRGVMHLL